MQDKLREEVRVYKAKRKVSYKQIAEELKISINSFYNWLKGYYDLSVEREVSLRGIIKNKSEGRELTNDSSKSKKNYNK
ncbi:MAG: helix-turn-helix domain-containing protein [Clostridia bacterium]|nr:helix-turn-helix domain-containing protein [Clostridia bacterium]MBQ9792626.1 helix-turn-helix domain-containing protein [Clostridia bacterium]